MRVKPGDVFGNRLRDGVFGNVKAWLAPMPTLPVHRVHVMRGSEKLLTERNAVSVNDFELGLMAGLWVSARFLNVVVFRAHHCACEAVAHPSTLWWPPPCAMLRTAPA